MTRPYSEVSTLRSSRSTTTFPHSVVDGATDEGFTLYCNRPGGHAAAIVLQSLWGLLIGLLAPFVTRWYVSRQVKIARVRIAGHESGTTIRK